MRKIIGIGETILDIIFKEGKPSQAVPGGSTFNSLISLGRLGMPTTFISEIGQDTVGDMILDFMRTNNVGTENLDIFTDGKTPISLAFLDSRNEARYMFYNQFPQDRLNFVWPRIDKDDIIVFGSYFALNPAIREKVCELIEYAKTRKAIIYYDPNFRSSHKDEAIKLAPTIIENLEYANIVRGSREDFFYMYGQTDADKIYKDKIKFYCPNFLCTAGAESIALRTGNISKNYSVEPIQAVSTIGAGDNFNAGIIFGLLTLGVRYRDLNTLDEGTWDQIIRLGMEFSREVCCSFNNSVSPEFAAAHRYRR